MAVTIDANQVAVAIRVATDVDAVPVATALVLSFAFDAASEMVVHYAPEAPDSLHNAAAIRIAGFLYDADPSTPVNDRILEMSGAASILSRFRVHRASALVEGPGGVSPSPPTPSGGNVPTPPGSGHFILTANNGALEWEEFPAP